MKLLLTYGLVVEDRTAELSQGQMDDIDERLLKLQDASMPEPSLEPCKHGLTEGTCTLCLGKRQPSSGPNPFGSRNVNPPPTGGISHTGLLTNV